MLGITVCGTWLVLQHYLLDWKDVGPHYPLDGYLAFYSTPLSAGLATLPNHVFLRFHASLEFFT